MTAGTLFTEDFLAEGILTSPAWSGVSEADLADLRAKLTAIFAAVKNPERLNEAQTEDRIIRKVLVALGWDGAFTVQTNMDRRGRSNVADMTFFPDADHFATAEGVVSHDAKLKFAVAVGDAKKWALGLDERGGGAAVGENPVAQVLRYLGRAEIASDRKVRFAILTNGRRWRIYYGGARSLLDGYYETDLAWLLGVAGAQGELTPPQDSPNKETEEARRDRLLKTFALVFRRESFSPDPALAGATFHDHAINEGRLWEAKVRDNLSEIVFDEVFPDLVRALAAADPKAPKPFDAHYLATVREGALALLYRLLFALYAEDRNLLPTWDEGYADYSLSRLRDEVARRMDDKDRLSERATRTWDHCAGLFRLIDEGDTAIGVPPYNGGLFARDRANVLERARLSDAAFVPLLDKLSRTLKDGRLVRINFRDLSVRELGAIYERLLEREPIADAAAPGGIAVRPNAFSRKNSGSYYTPDELVTLIIERTVGPLIDEKVAAFKIAAEKPGRKKGADADKLARLEKLDPAQEILSLRICDPAMGSGHFLVSLIDILALRVFTVMGEAEAQPGAAEIKYRSPLRARLENIRARILTEAGVNGWKVRADHLSDQNLIRRMVLKRCVYGVDKNEMAVELAKVALWLHTFTAGAPLSFLDHHLRCGDSLFGEKVRRALDELAAQGLFPALSDPLRKAEAAFAAMEKIEAFTDAAIAEVKASADAFADVEGRTAPVKRFLDVWQAAKWLLIDDKRNKAKADDRRLYYAIASGTYGNAFDVLSGATEPSEITTASPDKNYLDEMAKRRVQAVNLLQRLRAFAAEERFLHWEVAFPGVWRNWQSAEPSGGFDAVIGNPPWDRMKMQEVEWFAARAPKIAKQARAADRKAEVAKLREKGDSLAAAYDLASARAEAAMERARKSGDYPLLSKGDTNLYSLFVERAQSLLRLTGISGLLTPSGILSDKSSEMFLREVVTQGRVIVGVDFFNKRLDGTLFFPDVYYRFKFTAFICARSYFGDGVGSYGFFVRSVNDAAQDKLIPIDAKMIDEISPTAFLIPILRSEADFDLAVRLADSPQAKRFGELSFLKYRRLFDMGTDSDCFMTIQALSSEGAYPLVDGQWRNHESNFERLFEGKMVQAFDHRAASIGFYAENTFRTGENETTTIENYSNPEFLVTPRYFVRTSESRWESSSDWALAIKDVTSTTNTRSVIAALIPRAAVGHTLPVLFEMNGLATEKSAFACANFNAFTLDFFARQKIQNNHLTLNIIQQLPLIAPDAYSRSFGASKAADIVINHVLRLTYTARDMRPFARDLGYGGEPFIWNEEERRHLRARLDALYLHL